MQIPENLIPWSISAASLLLCYLTFMRNGKKDSITEEHRFDGLKESMLKANMKLDQVCATTNETRTDIKTLTKDMQSLDVRISVVERDLKTAFSKIDELNNKQ